MIPLDSAAITREAQKATIGHTGSTHDLYESALSRYLGAVAGKGPGAEPQPVSAPTGKRGPSAVRDVMTRDVVTVTETTSFKDIVGALGRNRVSAVPVVDADHKVVGIVSESDLLAKVVASHVRSLGIHGHRAKVHGKAGAETAGGLMTAPAITVAPDDSIVLAARIAAAEGVRRLPVVDNTGVLVGIVTRSDLLRVFLGDDGQLRDFIVRSVLPHQFGLDTSHIKVSVQAGVVTLTGQVERRQVAPLIEAVRATEGVVGVHDGLT
jgi:CBS domain-containing protein